MLFLHAIFLENRFWLWGEKPVDNPALLATPSKRSPFDPEPEALAAALAAFPDPIYLAPDVMPVSRALALPPEPSDPVLLPLSEGKPTQPPARGTSTLVPLATQPAFALLSQIRDQRQPVRGVFIANDLQRLSELFRYAGALVARGRFLPDIRPAGPGAYDALWTPCFDYEEDSRLRALAARLPSCASDLPAAQATETILNLWVDSLVRSSVVTTLSRAQAERGKFYSVHDAWFSALRGESPRIRWSSQEELADFCKTLADWRRPITGTRAMDVRPSFELQAPAVPDGTWFLAIHLPSPQPDETMLLVLGQAALLFPVLGIARAWPEGLGCRLQPAEAYAFIASSAALLKAAGFEVSLPENVETGRTGGLSLAADLTPETQSDHYQPDEPVAVHWSVLFNGMPVSQDEIRRLLAADSPLVFFRGKWITVDRNKLQEALRLGKQTKPETETGRDAVQLVLGTGGLRHGMNVEAVRGGGWIRTLLERLAANATDKSAATPVPVPSALQQAAPVPSDFCGELRPYQLRGYRWILQLRDFGFGACLADDMGLGKTIQALAYLLHQKETADKPRGPALIVGPLSVLGNWMREAKRFAPTLTFHLHHGTLRWHGAAFAEEMARYDVVITSYTLLYRDYNDLRRVHWSDMILDEAQNIKNPDTRQTQAARALLADYRLALTGTPIENNVGDLWAIIDFLNPDLLGTRRVFREAFFRPIQTGTDPGARTRLRRIAAPFILRRLKTDKSVIHDLPEKIEGKVYCPLTEEQAKLYREELDTFRTDLADSIGIQRRGRILAVLTRLKQICNHPIQYLGGNGAEAADTDFAERSGKLTRLSEQLEEVFSNNESALVFTQYAQMGGLLATYFSRLFGHTMPFLHGGVPRLEREKMIDHFQTADHPHVFILSLKAGGTGLNLTRATHVFHYDRWWNPAVENQATDRAFRIGQTHRVVVHKFVCSGTLEDRIDAMIESKTALASEIITQGEHALTELSDDALQELLALREDKE